MTVSALVLGTVLGLCVTAGVLSRRFNPAAAQIGAWTFWPKAGTAAMDPYGRAITAQSGEVPVASAEGMRLTASVDQSGFALSGRCDYRMAGGSLPARIWTVSLLSPAGRPETNPVGRYGFASSSLLRDGDGVFTIDISRFARTGNWLPAPDGPFRLTLHLYEPTLGPGGAPATSLPSIERTGCRP